MTARQEASADGALDRPRPAVDLEIVVPAANEEARIGRTLAVLIGVLDRLPFSTAVVVVDNASTDRTAEIARDSGTSRVPVHVLSCPAKGKGFAVRSGVASGRSRWVGFMDADLATDLGALPVVVAELEAGRSAVIGSRALALSEVTARHRSVRRLGAHAFRSAVAAVVPGISDTQCGFKFFDGDVARAVFAEVVDGGFAFDVELLARFQARGLDVLEIPVCWEDQPGSTFRPTRDGWSSFYQVWRIARRTRPARSGLRSPVTSPALAVVGREAELATGA